MKSRPFFFGRLLLSAAAIISFSGFAHALTKADNNTALNAAGSWVENTTPTTTDLLLFNSTGVPTAGGLTVAAANATFGGSLQFTDIAGNVTITQSSGQTWTLSSGGVDMSTAAADVTIGVSGAFFRWGSTNYGGLSVASGRTLTINSNFSNAGNTKTIAMSGPGNIILNGAAGSGGAMGFSITGGANVTMNGAGGWGGTSAKEVINGTLNIGNDAALGGATLTMGGTSANTPTITASDGARTIFNGITLAAVTTGSGTIAGANALTVNGTLLASGGPRTLVINNSGLTTFGGNILLSSDNTTTERGLTIGGTGNTLVSGVIANNNVGNTLGAALTYNGSGTLTLSGSNTYGGTTTISSGTVKIGNFNALGNGRTSLSAGATMDLNGNSLGISSLYNGAALSGGIVDNVSAGGNITLTIGSGIGGNSASNTTYTSIASFSGVIKNTTGTVGLTKVSPTTPGASIMATASRLTGASVLTLTGANTYTGATTIKGGFLQLLPQNTTPIISSSSALVLQGGGLVSINNTGISPSQTFAGTTLNAGASQVSPLRQSSTSNTINLGAITRNIGSTLNFYGRPSGGSSNAYLGAADGTANTSTANTGGILGGYAVSNGNTWAVGGGNITGLALASYSATLTTATNVDVSAAGLTGGSISVNSLRFLNATTSTTTAPAITLSGDLVVTTGGILTVGGVYNTATSGATVNASITGNFNLTSGNSQDLIFITNNLGGTGVANMNVSSNITNNGGTSIGLTKSGLGTLTLAPATANTFTGQVTVNAGNLLLGNANALNGNDVVFGGSSEYHDVDNISLVLQNGTLSLNGNNATAGSLASSTDSSGTAVVRNAGGSAVSNTTFTLNGAASTSFAGTIIDGTGGGTLGLTKSGSGTQALTGANSFTGVTTLSGGKLSVATIGNGGVTGNLGAATAAAGNLVFDGGTLQYTGATASTDRNFTINTGKTAIFEISNNNLTVSGASAATDGALTKTGVGTLTLTNTNSYSGTTTINGGTLKLDTSGTIDLSNQIIVGNTGSSGAVLDVSAKTGGFTIGSTQKLSGIGTVDANDAGTLRTVTIEGTHAVGNSPGSQTVDGNLAYASSSIFEWDLAANKDTDGVDDLIGATADNGVAGTDYDALTVTGTLNIASDAVFKVIQNAGADFSDAFWTSSQSWSNIFNATGAVTSGWNNTAVAVYNTSNVLQDVSVYGSFSITGSTLTWSAVPEPTSALAGLLIGAGLLRRRRA
jgi:fibronectin-binding autotransporter adhesin